MVTYTIKVSDSDDVRTKTCFGPELGLRRDATQAEIETQMFNFVQGVVIDQEHASRVKTSTDAAIPFLPA